MADTRGQLEAVLNGHAKFARGKQLVPPEQQPYLVRWVREFLGFAADHPGYTFGISSESPPR